MSKIEDALNKARKSTANQHINNINNISKASINKLDSELSKNDIAIVSNNSSLTTTNHKSSVKEIANMKQANVLEEDILSELKIIYTDMVDNKIANTYRDLRTKLLQSSKGNNFIAMITSVVEGDQSSNMSINLAAAFSFDESKTSLLLDCNINNPKLDDMLSMDISLGITDYLEDDNIDVDTIVHESGIKRLRLIPAGTRRETATEYFTSLRMRNLTASLLDRYSDRFIFIDTSPITESADARILAELCDFVILVVPYGMATTSKIKEAADAIGKEKLLGVVFSDIPKLPSYKSLGINH